MSKKHYIKPIHNEVVYINNNWMYISHLNPNQLRKQIKVYSEKIVKNILLGEPVEHLQHTLKSFKYYLHETADEQLN